MLSVLRLKSARRFSSYAPKNPRTRRRGIVVASGVALAGSAAAYANHTNHEVYTDGGDHLVARAPVPLSSLFRSYIVYSMCSMPMLVDQSPSILSVLSSVPGIKQITEAVVRRTFFSQASPYHRYMYIQQTDFHDYYSSLGEIPLRDVFHS